MTNVHCPVYNLFCRLVLANIIARNVFDRIVKTSCFRAMRLLVKMDIFRKFLRELKLLLVLMKKEISLFLLLSFDAFAHLSFVTIELAADIPVKFSVLEHVVYFIGLCFLHHY